MGLVTCASVCVAGSACSLRQSTPLSLSSELLELLLAKLPGCSFVLPRNWAGSLAVCFAMPGARSKSSSLLDMLDRVSSLPESTASLPSLLLLLLLLLAALAPVAPVRKCAACSSLPDKLSLPTLPAEGRSSECSLPNSSLSVVCASDEARPFLSAGSLPDEPSCNRCEGSVGAAAAAAPAPVRSSRPLSKSSSPSSGPVRLCPCNQNKVQRSKMHDHAYHGRMDAQWADNRWLQSPSVLLTTCLLTLQ